VSSQKRAAPEPQRVDLGHVSSMVQLFRRMSAKIAAERNQLCLVGKIDNSMDVLLPKKFGGFWKPCSSFVAVSEDRLPVADSSTA
jgi:hypothetical protein